MRYQARQSGSAPQEEGLRDEDHSGHRSAGGHTPDQYLPRQLSAAAAARRFVRQATDGHPAADEALLLHEELIANSLVHALDATTVTITVAGAANRSSASMSVMTAPSASRTCAEIARMPRTAAACVLSTRSPSGGDSWPTAGSCCWAEVTTPAT